MPARRDWPTGPARARRAAQLTNLLTGGDRRSLARTARAVQLVLEDRRRVRSLIDALGARDPVVALRAADACEKVSRRRPEWFASHRPLIVRHMVQTTDPVVRWNLVQVMPRLRHDPRQLRQLARRLRVWFWNDASTLVRVAALTAVADLATYDPALALTARELIDEARASASAAIRARARLLAK